MNIEYTTAEQIEQMREELRLARQKEQARQSNRFLRMLEISGKVLGHVLFYTLVICLLAVLVSILVTKSKGKIPSVFGYQMYVVETGSMIPTLPIGCTIVVRELHDGDTLSVGDIITYAHESAVITHRITQTVVGKDGVTRYQTQGDNPDNSADPWLVERENVRGIVIWHFSLNLLGQ